MLRCRASNIVTDVFWVVILFTDMWMDIRMANWIGHIVRRNCLPRHVIDLKIEGTRRRRRRRKQPHWVTVKEKIL